MHSPYVFKKSQSLKNKKRSLLEYCSDLKEKHNISKDPIAYLEPTFKEPAALLSVMFDTGSIISGSRALEFFVPGSTDETSDWDFYIPAFRDAIVDMINILNKCCNIEWKSAADVIGKNKKTVSRELIANLRSWPNNHTNEILRAYADGSLTADDTMDYPDKKMESYDFVGLTFPMMEGTIKLESRNVKIQLIIASWNDFDTSLLRFIGRFYASHVQCFIGGWYACHMYYQMAQKKKAYKWLPNNQQTDEKTQEAIEKYVERSYKFIEPQCREKMRFFKDRESKFIDFWGMYDCIVKDATVEYAQHYIKRREQLRGVMWIEFGGELMLNPPDRQALIRNYYDEIPQYRYKIAQKAAEGAKKAARDGDEEVKKVAKSAKKAAKEANKAARRAEITMGTSDKIMRLRLANDVTAARKIYGFQSSIESATKQNNGQDWGISELANSGLSANTFNRTTPSSWSF
ncbi:hypothetical protein V8C42DRAFT_338406 [Trichoderma barbatum]